MRKQERFDRSTTACASNAVCGRATGNRDNDDGAATANDKRIRSAGAIHGEAAESQRGFVD